MVKIGCYNTLEVVKVVDFGLYLNGGNGVEILLPTRYIKGEPQVGEKLEVYIYIDSEGRLIATTEHPYAQVGDFAYLEVVDVNKVGAFLDWGLPTKHLLCQFREQKIRMTPGRTYLVYIYLDDNSKRIVASAKIEKFLGNTIPEYQNGQEVKVLVYKHTDLGYKAIVDNQYGGMIYDNELFRPLEIGEEVIAYIKQVRPDGKIDLTLSGKASDRIEQLAEQLMDYIISCGGVTPLCDKSTPEEIKKALACSKKDFKKAAGALYKSGKINITETGISIV